jgi:KDO2-lipid IV(A) lauroyltransferase
LGGFFLGVLGFPTSTVARTLDNPHLNRFINRFRGITGQRMISKKGGFDDILAVLASGGTMTFLADQAAGDKGCWVDFFGRPASTHKAIALLALEHKAHVCVGAMMRVGGPLQLEMTLGDLIDTSDPNAPAGNVRELTQWYTTQIERLIRKAPEQYWWVHRRWKGTPPSARRKSRAA